MPTAALPAGPVGYTDTGGSTKPTVVLTGGLAISGNLWDPVVERLRQEFRCVAVTLPLGAHREPMALEADLSLGGLAEILESFLGFLDVRDVTFVECDTGTGQMLAGRDCERIARMVLCSCETAENYPPGLPGRTLAFAAKLPGGVNAAMQQLRVRALRRTPFAFGRMAKHPIPDATVDDWLRPLQTQRAIRRDLTKYLRSGKVSRQALFDATGNLGSFDRPVLVVWAREDRVMPLETGRHLAGLFPQARLVEIDDSYTLIPADQPERLASEIRSFVHAAAPPS
jgi:pimeloyl-ACP methyl ester carboxylesterase